MDVGKSLKASAAVENVAIAVEKSFLQQEAAYFFDSVNIHFDSKVFLIQFFAQLFPYPFILCGKINALSHGYILPSIDCTSREKFISSLMTCYYLFLYNYLVNFAAYLMIIAYFMLDTNKIDTNSNTSEAEVYGNCIFIPLLVFIMHRGMSSFRYATMSPTEYAKVKKFSSHEQVLEMQMKTQILSAWKFRTNKELLLCESAAASILASINAAHTYFIIEDPESSESAAAQFKNWRKFLAYDESVFKKQADGSYRISCMDSCVAILKYSSCKDLGLAYVDTYVRATKIAAILLPLLFSLTTKHRITPWVIVLLTSSTFVLLLLYNSVFDFMGVALIDATRRVEEAIALASMLRLSDLFLPHDGNVTNTGNLTHREMISALTGNFYEGVEDFMMHTNEDDDSDDNDNEVGKNGLPNDSTEVVVSTHVDPWTTIDNVTNDAEDEMDGGFGPVYKKDSVEFMYENPANAKRASKRASVSSDKPTAADDTKDTEQIDKIEEASPLDTANSENEVNQENPKPRHQRKQLRRQSVENIFLESQIETDIPRLAVATASGAQGRMCLTNILCWNYLRLILLYVGERYLFRLSLYIVAIVLVTFALMALILVLLIKDIESNTNDTSYSFGRYSMVLQSIISAVLAFVLVMLAAHNSSRVNIEYEKHEGVIEAQRMLIENRIAKNAENHQYSGVGRDFDSDNSDNVDVIAVRALDECKKSIVLFNKMRPFRFCGFEASSKTFSLLLSAFLTFFSSIISIYFAALAAHKGKLQN